MDLIADLCARAEALAGLHPDRRVLIGIAGAPGAGKTTLAETLVQRLAGDADRRGSRGADWRGSPSPDWRGSRVAHVPMDGFHLADVELERLGLLDRKGAPETFDVDGYRALLTRIRAGDTVYAPSFERTLEQAVAGALPVLPATRIVITEGNYLLLPDAPWQAVRAQLDEVWFVRVEADERRHRLVQRQVGFGKDPDEAQAWTASVDEPNALLVDATEPSADLVLDRP